MLFLLLLQDIEDQKDRDRLTEFYLNYSALLKNKALDILGRCGWAGRGDLVEDLVQDTMVRLIKRMETIKKLSQPQLVAYGVKTVQSCALDYCRREAVRSRTAFAAEVLEEAPEDPVWREYSDDGEEQLFLRLGQVLAALPQRDRDILIYKYFLEYDDKRIAALLGVKADSVRMALTRARQRVKAFWSLETVGKEGS